MRAVANVFFVMACAGHGHADHRSAAQTQSTSYDAQQPSKNWEFNTRFVHVLAEKAQSSRRSGSIGALQAQRHGRLGALGALKALASMSLTAPPQAGWLHAGHGHSLATRNRKGKVAARRAAVNLDMTGNSDAARGREESSKSELSSQMDGTPMISRRAAAALSLAAATAGGTGHLTSSAYTDDLLCFECNLERRLALKKDQPGGLPTIWGAVSPRLKLEKIVLLNDTDSYDDVLNETISKYDPFRNCVLVWFQGTESKGRLAWDIQTRINSPIVEKVLLTPRYSNDIAIIVAYVKKDEYKNNPDYAYRTNKLVNLTSLPTILRYDRKDLTNKSLALDNIFVRGRLDASNISEQTVDVLIA